MISLWVTIGLVIAAVSVASLGAFFSISGLGALFSGALLAVCLMAAALEFSKFVLAAYLHQTWKTLNIIYRSYLVFAVVVLSVITSIGIFGFLSEAYQSASTVLEAETIKLDSIRNQQASITAEIERLNKSVEEIPERRITKRLKSRAEIEPTILELNKKFNEGERLLTASNLKILEVKKKVGPLIYIAKSLDMNIDVVVRYLILILVSVFDPLAICLVIASTQAIGVSRSLLARAKNDEADQEVTAVPTPVVAKVKPAAVENTVDEDIIVQMNFKDEHEDKKAV